MPAYYQFSTLVLHPRAADEQPMVSAPETILSERHVPYSDLNILDIGGKSFRRWAVKLRVAPDDITALEALLLVSAELTVAGVTWPRATLTSLTNHTMTPMAEWHQYDATWVVG